ncbi:hypothetical protein B0H19DRAFT_1065443 [Mycena capillaripes]|nr:hypothetical protein B0H19DRAFT_1065443 [Mycena capillaripes]
MPPLVSLPPDDIGRNFSLCCHMGQFFHPTSASGLKLGSFSGSGLLVLVIVFGPGWPWKPGLEVLQNIPVATQALFKAQVGSDPGRYIIRPGLEPPSTSLLMHLGMSGFLKFARSTTGFEPWAAWNPDTIFELLFLDDVQRSPFILFMFLFRTFTVFLESWM